MTLCPGSRTNERDPLLSKGCVCVAEWSYFAQSPLSLKQAFSPSAGTYKRRNIGFVVIITLSWPPQVFKKLWVSIASLLGL